MKKIMFNDKYGLTQAVLSGRKTMTRRFVPDRTPFGCWRETVKRSRYQVGEVVAIAQSYKDAKIEFIPIEESVLVGKKSEARQWGYTKNMAGYHNKMFVRANLMPHHIRITDIKVEWLQDISDEDCIKEGIKKLDNPIFGVRYEIPNYFQIFNTPREAFTALIDNISGKGAWESNPWVFAYEFKLVD